MNNIRHTGKQPRENGMIIRILFPLFIQPGIDRKKVACYYLDKTVACYPVLRAAGKE